MMQMAVVLTYGGGQPVVKVDALPRQFGKRAALLVEVRDRHYAAKLPRR